MTSPLKHILADPSLAYYYGQKALRFLPLRKVLARAITASVAARKPAMPVTGAVASRIARELESAGFAALPEKQMSGDTLAQARDYLAPRPLHDFYGTGRQYIVADKMPEGVTKAVHSIADVAGCKPLMDLANDPDILAAVAQRLGATPTIATVSSLWTFGENNTQHVVAADDIYHRDVDDLRFVKLFVYLTDTQIKSGAHRFVLGSHADDHLARRGPISDEAVDSIYSPDKLLTVSGPAGTAFLEETWGIHRALLATEGRRMIFSVIYVIAAKLPFGPPKPVLPLPAGYDRYINRRLYY